MKITIEIPKEFEEHYNNDNFAESLTRIDSDIRFQGFLSGLLEVELIEMLKDAFKGSKQNENEQLKQENEQLQEHNKYVLDLIKAERKRQEQCNDVHLRDIATLEKENEQLKQQITEAKENGVVWHDLRKNPNDLPQKVGDYIVAIKFKYLKGCDTTILRYDEDEDEDKLSWIDSEYTNCNDDVIAWCEIPKFRVESK